MHKNVKQFWLQNGRAGYYFTRYHYMAVGWGGDGRSVGALDLTPLLRLLSALFFVYYKSIFNETIPFLKQLYMNFKYQRYQRKFETNNQK